MARSMKSMPIKAFVYSSLSKQTGLHVGFAVTREIRKAAQRNLLKRLMREAFRSKKEDFIANIKHRNLQEIVFLYIDNIGSQKKKGRFESIKKAFVELSSTINIIHPK